MIAEHLYGVIIAPHISEKATRAADQNRQVVFKVKPASSKLQIKKAVEQLFGVEVSAVNTLNVKGKSKRFGRFVGQRSAWKKAYVTLKPGHDIDFAQNNQ